MNDMPLPPGVPGGSSEGAAQTPLPVPPGAEQALTGVTGGSSVSGLAQDGIQAAQAAGEGNASAALSAGLDAAATGTAMYFGGEPAAQVTRAVMKSEVGTGAKKGIIVLIGVVVGAVIMSLMSAGSAVVAVATSVGGAAASMECYPIGGATPIENPTQEEIVGAIYAQVKGFGYGDFAAAVAIATANTESTWTNMAEGDQWADGSGMTTSRGVYQQFDTAAEDLAWSGKPKPPRDSALLYNKDNAWGPDGWAVQDPRMNVPQAINIFILGNYPTGQPQPGQRGNWGMDSPYVPYRAKLTTDKMPKFREVWDIAYNIQGFSDNWQNRVAAAAKFPQSMEMFRRVKSGEIPIPTFVPPLEWMAGRANSPQTQAVFESKVITPSEPAPGGSSASTNANERASTQKVGSPVRPSTPPAFPGDVAQDGVTFVGDSVMRGLLDENSPPETMFGGPAIRNSAGGITLGEVLTANRYYSRSEKREVDVSKWRKDISTGPSRILVQLGTNDGGDFDRNYANIQKFMQLAGQRQVYWYSQHYTPSKPMQEALEKAAGEYQNLHLIPVLDLLPGGTYGNELHPYPAYEAMWQRAMQAMSESAQAPVDEYCTEGTGSGPDGPIEVNPGSSWVPGVDAVKPVAGYSINVKGGRNMTYYSQCDDDWRIWNGYNMCGCGCGHTSMAMVIATLAPNSNYTPPHAYTEQRRLGGVYGNCGTAGGSDSFFRTMAWKYKVPSWDINEDFDAARRTLEQGGLVTVSINQGTVLTPAGGHYVVLRGIAPDGRFLIADPGNRAFTVSAGFSESVFRGSLKQGMVAFLPPGETLR